MVESYLVAILLGAALVFATRRRADVQEADTWERDARVCAQSNAYASLLKLEDKEAITRQPRQVHVSQIKRRRLGRLFEMIQRLGTPFENTTPW